MQLTENKKTASASAGTVDYESELERLYSAITGTKKFSYSPNTDSAFKSYADIYIKNGRTAMADTMGAAASLTGGYGSSYAQSVGAQQYEKYLQALSAAMPEFYSLALEKYNTELGSLKDQYAMLSEKEQQEYDRARDALADTQAQEKTDYSRAQDAYAKLVKLISTSGYRPKDEELALTGLTSAQAQALISQYNLENGISGAKAVGSTVRRTTK